MLDAIDAEIAEAIPDLVSSSRGVTLRMVRRNLAGKLCGQVGVFGH